MDADEQRVDAESEDHETEQMDQPSRVKIIALSGTVVEEARRRNGSTPWRLSNVFKTRTCQGDDYASAAKTMLPVFLEALQETHVDIYIISNLHIRYYI